MTHHSLSALVRIEFYRVNSIPLDLKDTTMDERTKKFGAFERFLIEQPKASVILMCSFVGVLVLTVELLFWPRMNDDPAFYWAMRYISLLTILGVFIAVYNLNQENLSRWGSDITNSWDQKVVNLLARKHLFLYPPYSQSSWAYGPL